MSRLLAPADRCVGVEVGGATYDGQTIDVANRQHLKALKAAGYTVAATAGPPVKARGYECPSCGFRGYFRTCSRCAQQEAAA